MKKVREIIQYKNYFEEFLLAQPSKVQDKIFKVLEIIETYQRVPATYLKEPKVFTKLGLNWDLIFGGYSAFLIRGNWSSCSMGLLKKRRRPRKRKLTRQLI